MKATKKLVDRQIQFLAELLGKPLTQCRELSPTEQGAIQGRRNFEWNIGALYLDGFNLAEIANQGGGIYIILYGHSLQDIFGKIVAYHEGFERCRRMLEEEK